MLKGKTALVTGASRGIGKAIALKLAAEGVSIVLNYVHNKEEADKTVQEIENFGVRALAVQTDVSVFDHARVLVNKVKEEFGAVDILVNNAGITRDGFTSEAAPEPGCAMIPNAWKKRKVRRA